MKLLLSILFCIFATVESRPVRLHGLNYNTRQGPDWMPYDQRCKSRKQVWTDLSLLHKITDRVRLLSVRDCDQASLVLDVAKEIGMQVWLGLWVDRDDNTFNQEMQAFEDLLQSDLFDDSMVLGVTVGSEALHRKDVTEEKLLSFMDQVKNLLATSGHGNILVSAVDISYQYRMNERLREKVDVVYINIFPYFNWNTNDHTWGAEHSLVGDASNVLQLSTSGTESKRLVIGETGWPESGGRPGTEGRASPENQAQYFSNFYCLVDFELNWEYYWFTGIDNAWRAEQNSNNGIEGTWGFFTSDLELKPQFQDLTIDCGGSDGLFSFAETDWSIPVPPESCQAHSACSGIGGDCCPTADGTFLGCCENAPTMSPSNTPPTMSPTTSMPTITASPTEEFPIESCQAHKACWDQGLRGDCCPSSTGIELGKTND